MQAGHTTSGKRNWAVPYGVEARKEDIVMGIYISRDNAVSVDTDGEAEKEV